MRLRLLTFYSQQLIRSPTISPPASFPSYHQQPHQSPQTLNTNPIPRNPKPQQCLPSNPPSPSWPSASSPTTPSQAGPSSATTTTAAKVAARKSTSTTQGALTSTTAARSISPAPSRRMSTLSLRLILAATARITARRPFKGLGPGSSISGLLALR
jgi:hypothetical protein